MDAVSPRVRREDLDALMDGYVRRRRPLQRAMVGVGFWGLALPVLIKLAKHLGWPQRLEDVFYVGGSAIMLACIALVLWRDRTLRRRYQFRCPACDASLLDGIRDHDANAYVELVSTGRCPRCGAALLSP